MQNSDFQFYQTPKHDLRRSPMLVQFSRGFYFGWLRALAFIGLDAIAISLGWITTQWSVYTFDALGKVGSFQLIRSSGDRPAFLLPILVITISIIASAYLYGERPQRRKYIKLTKCLALAQIVLLVLAFLYQPGVVLSRSTFLLAWLFTSILVVCGRFFAETVITTLRHQGTVTRKIALIGRPEETKRARFLLRLISKKEFKIVDCLDWSIPENSQHWQKIQAKWYAQGVGEVFICSWQSIDNPMELCWSVKTAGMNLRIVPIDLEIPNQRSQIELIGGMPTIKFRPPMLVGSDFWTKRMFDLTVAALILGLGFPIYLLIAILIKLDSPGPIFFKQTRIGLRGKKFQVWKFRTMVVNAEQLMKELEAKNEIEGGVLFKMKDDPRITKIGHFLRRYSLDELPQLINVLIGDMSLVGPRPLPIRDVKGFAKHHFLRHNVTPGITGLWQVSGRSNITNFDDAFKLDMDYINNWSLTLDFRILIKTVKVVLRKEGAY